jgi:phosphoserine phosphatase RsbU/P
VEALGAFGTILGATRDAVLSDVALHLAPGDVLVLYTDGVTDTRGEHERFGARRLEALVGELADARADELVGGIDEALLAFQHGDQRDDVALLVLRAASDSPDPGDETSVVGWASG